ncbi:MAG TPA: hypothetical protein VGQ83_36795 [Polyangia bacterium]|jgi:hypothetical protein
MLPSLGDPAPARPLWLVCEDGTEYVTRFARFLGGEFRFARVGGAAALLAAAASAQGVVLDLDFRRTPPEELVDERGEAHPALEPDERRRLSESQGILILRALRAGGSRLPALLCADLDDPGQVAFLEATLAPLRIVPSTESLAALAARLRAATP